MTATLEVLLAEEQGREVRVKSCRFRKFEASWFVYFGYNDGTPPDSDGR